MFKSYFACQVEAYGAAISSSVERSANGVILLLAGSVPNLNSYDGIIDHNFFLLEVRSDCGFCVLRVLALSISKQKRCFADI